MQKTEMQVVFSTLKIRLPLDEDRINDRFVQHLSIYNKTKNEYNGSMMKTIREFLEEQINEQLIQAVVSGRRTGEGPSKVKLRPVELKGKATIKTKHHETTQNEKVKIAPHNRVKQYILKEGTAAPFLVDLGVMTKDGKIVASRYDKFRQINRFLEFIRDILPKLPKDREITILDFGCGKSYLTFAMYYYLRELEGFDVNVIGLDLKEDVIRHCSELARSYGYDKLHFYQGDIAGYEGVSSVDMVVTLHACDTATDFALAKAVEWGAQVILSVPCCQHELNRQIRNETLQPIMRYGILKERMAALITDGLRAELLESKGYDTQLLEFIDMEHTPKNILIRAVKTGKKKSRDSFADSMKALHVNPTLDRLLYPDESASQKGE